MTRDRPYMHHRIAQLEAVLERADGDTAVLQRLAYELSLRKTDRAARLRARVAERLRLALATPSKARHPAEASPRAGPPVKAPPSRPATTNRTPRAEASRSSEAAASGNPSDLPASPAPSILAAWTALEVLSPRTFRRPEDLAGEDRWAVAKLTGGGLPWEADGERSRKNYQLYYQVFLGAIPMDRAAERLMAAFGADEEQRPRPGEKAAMAAVLVDRHGVPLAEKAASLSSFAWGLPLALGRDFAKLGGWGTLETTVTKELEELVRRVDRDGRALPLDRPTIARAHRWLVERFGLPPDLVEQPSFALRVFHYYRAKTPPEPALVNSFFLGDLARSATMAADGTLPPGLARYLGATTPTAPVDLLADADALEAAVAPATMPVARWPAPGGQPPDAGGVSPRRRDLVAVVLEWCLAARLAGLDDRQHGADLGRPRHGGAGRQLLAAAQPEGVRGGHARPRLGPPGELGGSRRGRHGRSRERQFSRPVREHRAGVRAARHAVRADRDAAGRRQDRVLRDRLDPASRPARLFRRRARSEARTCGDAGAAAEGARLRGVVCQPDQGLRSALRRRRAERLPGPARRGLRGGRGAQGRAQVRGRLCRAALPDGEGREEPVFQPRLAPRHPHGLTRAGAGRPRPLHAYRRVPPARRPPPVPQGAASRPRPPRESAPGRPSGRLREGRSRQLCHYGEVAPWRDQVGANPLEGTPLRGTPRFTLHYPEPSHG